MARKKEKSSKDKPAADIYTALLGLTLLALTVGTAFVYMEMLRYNPNVPAWKFWELSVRPQGAGPS